MYSDVIVVSLVCVETYIECQKESKFIAFSIYYLYNVYAGRGAEAQIVTVKSTGRGFDPHSRKWNIYFHFIRSDVEAQRDVEFRHSARNVFRIRRKVGNGVS